MSTPSRARILLILAVGVVAVSSGSLLYRQAELAAGGPTPGFGLLAACGRMVIAGALLVPTSARAAAELRAARPLFLMALGSGVLVALHFAAWISSLQYTTVAASTALVNTNPVWVALLAWALLGERPRPRLVVGGLVAIAGSCVVALADAGATPRAGQSPLVGDALALVGAVAISGSYLLGRAVQQRGLSLRAYLGVIYPIAGLCLLPGPWLAGADYLGHPATVYLCFALMALVPQLVGHTSFNWAVKHVDPTLVAVVLLLEPVGSAVGAAALFGEVPSAQAIVGVALLLVGVLVAVRNPAPGPREGS